MCLHWHLPFRCLSPQKRALAQALEAVFCAALHGPELRTLGRLRAADAGRYIPRHAHLIQDLGTFAGHVRMRRMRRRKETVQFGLFLAFAVLVELSLWNLTPPVEYPVRADGSSESCYLHGEPGDYSFFNFFGSPSLDKCLCLVGGSALARHIGPVMHKASGVFGLSVFILGPVLGFFNGILPAWVVDMLFGNIDPAVGNADWWDDERGCQMHGIAE